MLKNNLKITLRSLTRRKTFSLINIVGLSLGMTAAIFAFLWVQNEFSFDRYHQHAENLHRINTDLQVSNDSAWHWAATPLPLSEVLENEVPEAMRRKSVSGKSSAPMGDRFSSCFSPSNFLRGKNFLKMKNTAFRKGLVVAQFAITAGLIIGAMVIFQQQAWWRWSWHFSR